MVSDVVNMQCNSNYFSVGLLEVVDELRNDPKQLLGVLISCFPKVNLDTGEKF